MGPLYRRVRPAVWRAPRRPGTSCTGCRQSPTPPVLPVWWPHSTPCTSNRGQFCKVIYIECKILCTCNLESTENVHLNLLIFFLNSDICFHKSFDMRSGYKLQKIEFLQRNCCFLGAFQENNNSFEEIQLKFLQTNRLILSRHPGFMVALCPCNLNCKLWFCYR